MYFFGNNFGNVEKAYQFSAQTLTSGLLVKITFIYYHFFMRSGKILQRSQKIYDNPYKSLLALQKK